MIFTDRRCEDMQATESVRAPETITQATSPIQWRGCARHQDDLLFGVRAALESGDANRLAGFYHWPGMGNAQGYRVADRLQAFTAKPLMDVRLVEEIEESGDSLYGFGPDTTDSSAPLYATPPYGDPYPTEPGYPDNSTYPAYPESSSDAVPAAPTAPARPRAAQFLRVDQMRSDQDAAAQVTYFRLRRHAGCWWLQF